MITEVKVFQTEYMYEKDMTAVSGAEDCTIMDKPHRVRYIDTNNSSLFLMYAVIPPNTTNFLAVWNLCHYLWSIAHESFCIVCAIFLFWIWPSKSVKWKDLKLTHAGLTMRNLSKMLSYLDIVRNKMGCKWYSVIMNIS